MAGIIKRSTVTKREMEFAIYCMTKEFNGNERKAVQRVAKMTAGEWDVAREMLKLHDAEKAGKIRTE